MSPSCADSAAHIIREPSKSFSRSVCALEADRRWISTATPIQNRLTDLFSLFKFLRCSPFDDKEVFNAQVTQNWKTRSDPDSVAKLKTLVNCLSIRRPKTTIELPPRINDIAYLDFNTEEWEDYQLVKAKTLYNLDHVRGGDGGTNFLNALKWVNELRLMCNHGPRNPNETHKIEKTPPAWSLQEAQARFDQLDGVGLAKCSNIACCQDLSSALSSETGAEHEDEPWIDESLELWCWLCFKGQGSARTRVFRICNHLPRCSRGQDTQGEEDRISVETDPPAPSSLKVFKKDDRLPTKVKRLLQDLLETPENIKRFAIPLLSDSSGLILSLVSSSPPGPRHLTSFSLSFGRSLSAASASMARYQLTAVPTSSVSSGTSPASACSSLPYLAVVSGST